MRTNNLKYQNETIIFFSKTNVLILKKAIVRRSCRLLVQNHRRKPLPCIKSNFTRTHPLPSIIKRIGSIYKLR